MTFCISEGFSEAFIEDLDVWGFGQVYKYLKRVDARRQITLVGIFRTAANADKKHYKEYLDSLYTWLPDAEKTSNKGTQSDFEKLSWVGKNQG